LLIQKVGGRLNNDSEGEVHTDLSEAFRQLNAEIHNEHLLASCHRMFDGFEAAYQRNVQLVGLCKEMNSFIVTNAQKVHDILKHSDEERGTLQHLPADFRRAQGQLSARMEAEGRLRAEIAGLKSQISRLRLQVELMTDGPESRALQQLQAAVERDSVSRERNPLVE
jgi:hypothetical protein